MHLPADAEALAALVDAAVERAMERIGPPPAAAKIDFWRREVYALDERVKALELHRPSLTDGQAEATVDDFAELANRLRAQERARAEPAANAESEDLD